MWRYFFGDHRGYSAPYGLWFAPYEPQPRGKIVRKGLLKSNAVTIGGITGTVVNVKDNKIVIETGADQVRIELEKWAISSNETAAEAKKAEAKKAQEAKAKAKAAKKAEKN